MIPVKLWEIALRGLGRHKRRSILTFIAVALGLALLIILNGFVSGVIEDSMQNGIRLQTGHVQVRSAGYEEEKLSLLWEDLLDKPADRVAEISASDEVKLATQVLWATSVINTLSDTVGAKLVGIELDSPYYQPIREGIIAGDFLSGSNQGEILLGKRLADSLGIAAGRKVNLTVSTGSDQVRTGDYTVRGIYETGVPAFDEGTIYMALPQAQALTETRGFASAIIIMLNRQADSNKVAAALQSTGTKTYTWESVNQVILEALKAGMNFYIILDAIVMLVVAVVIANTLLMAVFERTREIGILGALGMRKKQLQQLFLLEAGILALLGIGLGLVLGLLGVAYLSIFGINFGEAAAVADNMPVVGAVMRARFVWGTFAALSFGTLVICLLASLYPARFAAKMEPVDALRKP
jgi:ABC-type lipoprotein release transport system permease subunit